MKYKIEVYERCINEKLIIGEYKDLDAQYNKEMLNIYTNRDNIENQRNLAKKNIMIARKFACVKQMEEVKQEIALVDKGLYQYTRLDLVGITKRYRRANYDNMLQIHFKKALSQIEEAKSSTKHVENITKLKSQYMTK